MAGFSGLFARAYALFSRNPPTAAVVVDQAALEPSDRVLDVGCGAGAAVEQAARTIGADRVAAADPTPAFVEMVSRRVPGAEVRIAGAEHLPFDDRSFTVIFSIASMHHWDDRSAGLAELASKLAPGGRLLIAERLLRRPGHGITGEQLSDVEAALTNLGQIDVRTVVRPAGRRRLAILCSNRPADPSPNP